MAVAGGGPAGAAAAIRLARGGLEVLLIERDPSPDGNSGSAHGDETSTISGPKIGESLPPATRQLLADLGALPAFLAAGHLASHGNTAAWGGDEPAGVDFIRSPHGHGWHLDRRRFDADLRRCAVDAGARLATARLLAVERTGDGWRLRLAAAQNGGDRPPPVHCRWLIDATGRRRRVARALGVPLRSLDKQLAIHRFYLHPVLHTVAGAPDDGPVGSADPDTLALIEAVADGWWYTARLPGRRRVAVYFTDADLAGLRPALSGDGFSALVGETRHIAARLAGYRPCTEPRATAARTSRLERFAGERIGGWLATGDAAMAFDPLSSQGIHTALYGGLKAGEAILARERGDHGAVSGYQEALERVWERFTVHRLRAYRAEGRWPERPYWRRRR